MKYIIPRQMPSRSDFLTLFLDAVFPDLKELNCTRTGYGFTSACELAAKETGLLGNESEDNLFIEDSNIFRLMFEMAQNSASIFNRVPDFIADKSYGSYSETLFTFCDHTSGILKVWLKTTGGNNRVNKSFDAALFFSFLLLSRRTCAKSRIIFFNECLNYVGITDIEDTVSYKLFDFNWEELGDQGTIGEKTFVRLANKACILLGTVVLTIFELIGTYSAERDEAKLEKLHNIFALMFDKDIKASASIENAERTLYNCNKFFDPRSIVTRKKLYPQDFFVLPKFEIDGEDDINPLSMIKTASKGCRMLIVAKTGLGKSAFLQMATLCMLSDRFSSDEESASSLWDISEKLNSPEDMLVISVPAYMFSFCYKDERYRKWTTNFITLFFNCMWKLSDGINFYSKQSSSLYIANKESKRRETNCITEELTNYMRELARNGKLLLVLDSFDEIASGEMRTAYLESLKDFYNRYCCYPESEEIGAHVIVSSREMSPETMTSLEHALVIEHDRNKFGICSLNKTQRKELILKWNRFSSIPDSVSDEILSHIENNHYYLDYSVNPYMLSVVCFYFGHDLGSITQRLISTLVNKMLVNNRTADPIIQEVLRNIVKILQNVAKDTIIDGCSHFSRQKLDKYLSKSIDKADLTEDEIESYIEQLHEIFVTEVGLIVPADGADSDYQFINSQIRFELASKGIQRTLENDEQTDIFRDRILRSITSVEEYVGLMVPLLCGINLENVQLAEHLVSDLAMYDFKTDSDERVLIMAMMDLLLNRYGGSIATADNPGDNDAKYVRKAQRVLLMRILTSRNLKLSEKEKKDLLGSSAFTKNTSWFSDEVIEIMQ